MKQVPDTTEIKVDPVKNTLIREGVPAIVNPFDGYALEAAARIKDKNPDTKIIAVSMGLPKAAEALRECIAIAADQAYLISDRSFGGSDTLATSYIISEAIKKIETLEGSIDLIFCGKQAIDGDTAQVGPEIAEYLNLPQVTYALEAETDGDMIKVRKETEDGIEIIGAKMPALVTCTKSADKQGGELVAVVIGNNVSAAVDAANDQGADKIIVVEGEEYAHYSTDAYQIALCPLAEKYAPASILIGATNNGRDLGPRVSCRLKTGLIADCTNLDIDAESGNVAWTRPAFGGSLMATIL